MPFKIKLKKSRQYNVASKNILVISVQLLDNTNFECTLSSQSLGKECLGNLCQRLGLQQPEFFGLKFLSKRGTLWWIDLERPLKKQLERYAQDPHTPQLQFGVMFFVADVSLLQDEVTRYHYFLQLKTDIIEGHLKCNPKQAVLLAAYSLQAEFGAHDPERHTTEYLTNFALLPKSMTMNKEVREPLMEQVILTHRNLQDLAPSSAEIYYINECQQLDGYGQQIFSTKDHLGAILCIGASLGGVFVKPFQSSSHQSAAECFRWQEIVNLVHHRRYFGIECHESQKSLQCHLEDVDAAKYVWKMCAQQHRFYSSQRFAKEPSNKTLNSPSARATPSYYSESSSTDNSNRILASTESLDELGVYHTDEYPSENRLPISPEEVYVNIRGSNPNLPLDHQSLKQLHLSQQHMDTLSHQSPNLLQQKAATLQYLPQHGHPATGSTHSLQNEHHFRHHGMNENPLTRVSSSNLVAQKHSSASATAVFNGSQQAFHYSQPQNVSIEPVQNEMKELALPLYRQAPDYETAVMHKYGFHSASLGDVSVTSSAGIMPGTGINGSQPKINRGKPPQLYSHYKNYVDLSHIDSSNSLAENHVHAQHAIGSNLLMPPTQTYSTPELYSQGLNGDLTTEQLLATLQLNAYHQFKSPPPYPFGSQRPSTSTPDLTHNDRLTSPNNPELAARRPPIPEGGFHQNRSTYLGDLPPDSIEAISHQINHAMLNFGMQAQQPTAIVARTDSDNRRRAETMPSFSGNHNSSTSVEAPPVYHQDNAVISPNGYPNSTDLTNAQSPPTQMGPMFIAAMNGLTLSPPDVLDSVENRNPISRDTRIQLLESQLTEGQFFIEFEQIPKRKPMSDFRTALEPENLPRNRFKDVLPYEENRVSLTPTKDNRRGYINASHISVSVGNSQRFYIAAQGPMANTVHNFWQMVWEQHISLIVMLTETQEQGCEKCHPYWPQNDHSKIQVNEFQISRSFSVSSSTYVTCSLVLSHASSRSQRSVWHIQYTDWPDHRCPQDLQGFLSFMEEIDAVRRLALNEQPPGRGRNAPILVHCSAGVGRSGVVILCDIMLYSLDHANETLDLAKLLTKLRYQRMLTVQTLAQYKFVYSVLIQYLKNSRLI